MTSIRELSRYLFLAAVIVLFLPNAVFSDGSSLISTNLKYSILLSCCIITLLLPKYPTKVSYEIFFPLMLFCFFGMASMYWSINEQVSFKRSLFNVVLVFIFYLIATKLNRKAQNLLIENICVFVCLFIILGCAIPYVYDFPQAYHMGNFRGLFYNSNSLGHMIGVLLIPYTYIRVIRGGKLGLFHFVLLGLFIFFLIESRSRASILSAVIGIFFITICMRSKINKIFMICFLLICSFTVISLIRNPIFFVNKYNHRGNVSVLSTRAYLWKAHLSAIDDKIMLGWGLGVNPVSFKSKSTTDTLDTEKGNSFIALPEELGLPISVLIIFSLIPFFKKMFVAISIALKKSSNDTQLFPATIVLIGLVHGMFESWLFYFGNPMSFIFWLACINLATQKEKLTKIK